MPQPNPSNFDWRSAISHPAAIGAGLGGLAGALIPAGAGRKDGLGRRARNALLGAGLGGAAGYGFSARDDLRRAWTKLVGTAEKPSPPIRGADGILYKVIPGTPPMYEGPDGTRLSHIPVSGLNLKSQVSPQAPKSPEPSSKNPEPPPENPETPSADSPAASARHSGFDSPQMKGVTTAAGLGGGAVSLLQDRDKVLGGLRQMFSPRGTAAANILARGRLSGDELADLAERLGRGKPLPHWENKKYNDPRYWSAASAAGEGD